MVSVDQPLGRGKNHQLTSSIERRWLSGAGGLLLLAAAMETGLLPALETAFSSCLPHVPPDHSRLPHLSAWSRRRLLLTLLFLGVVGVHRPWQLRGYTGEGLALLTERPRAYGYGHTERFLSHLAQANGATILTDALATWTAHLWAKVSLDSADHPPRFYIDGHRKPVYSDKMIPRGLVGRLSTVLGCRALVLLHDEQGHPLLVLTHRGDQHLTNALPPLLARYEQASGAPTLQRIIVDREGLAAEFLARLKSAGRTVVSVLRTDQYTGLDSFASAGCLCAFADRLAWRRAA